MAPSNLAVIICHGSYHTPAPYGPLIEALRARGDNGTIEVYCPQLPTSDLTKLNVGDDPLHNPDFDLGPPETGYPQGEADVETVLAVLEPLVRDRERDVLLLGHSSGGWTATEAARPELQAPVRRARGLKGGVVGILYMGAFVIPVGESIHTFFQPKDGTLYTPPYMRFYKHSSAGLGTLVNAAEYLFHDISPAAAAEWEAGLTASPCLTATLTNDAYAGLPCAYLILEADRTLPREYQESMVALQEGKTGPFTVYRCPAGHSPHLSWTEGVVGTVMEFVGKVAAA